MGHSPLTALLEKDFCHFAGEFFAMGDYPVHRGMVGKALGFSSPDTGSTYPWLLPPPKVMNQKCLQELLSVLWWGVAMSLSQNNDNVSLS